MPDIVMDYEDVWWITKENLQNGKLTPEQIKALEGVINLEGLTMGLIFRGFYKSE